MKKHIPNFITSLNLLTGALGCFFMIEGNPNNAIYFVIVAAAFDFMDGFIARLLKVQSAIGKELDSLADVISFGLFPSVFIVMNIRNISDHPYVPYVGLIIVAFSAIRLAKFNIDTRQTHQFIGLPTPANAIMLTTLPFLPDSVEIGLIGYLVISVVSSLLLVANIPLIALKFHGSSWAKNKWKYSLVIAIALSIGVFQWSALPLIIPIYIIISVLNNYFDSESA